MTKMSADHDFGLQHDLKVMLQRIQDRRKVVSWLLSSGTAAILAGCGGSSGDDSSSSGTGGTGGTGDSTSDPPPDSCFADPAETSGPYPADGSNTVNGMASNVLTQTGIVRSDIRSSFGSSTTQAGGVPLTLTLRLVDANNLCANLSGYAVYVWHCSQEGNYSLYSAGVRNENYLRGVQVCDGSGRVTFQTIYPGCYPGRYPHLHFEVYPNAGMATLYTNATFTSQLAMPYDVSDTIYTNVAGYAGSSDNLAATPIDMDSVFHNDTPDEIAAMTPMLTGDVTGGYTSEILVGVPV